MKLKVIRLRGVTLLSSTQFLQGSNSAYCSPPPAFNATYPAGGRYLYDFNTITPPSCGVGPDALSKIMQSKFNLVCKLFRKWPVGPSIIVVNNTVQNTTIPWRGI